MISGPYGLRRYFEGGSLELGRSAGEESAGSQSTRVGRQKMI